MGEVYLGEHVDLRRPAVIKLIKGRYTNEEQVVGRMRREARIVARLRHDALVTIYDLGVAADGRTFIAMEYLDGTVLRRILQQRGALPVPDATRWMAQTCDGLDVAHLAGVIHRDVKPENLFVTSEGQLKVLDFGVAKPMNEGDATSARTAAGMVIGTPRYMAPEQATGRALSAATDVYAVGCVLYEMLAGSPLFDGNDARDLLYHHMYTPAPTLAERTRRTVAPELEALLRRALDKDPARRFTRAADMAIALRALGERPRISIVPAPISGHEQTFQDGPPTAVVRADDVPTRDRRPTLKVDEVRAMHERPTVKVDEARAMHERPTVKVEARISDVGDDTRPIAAHALVAGLSTTENQPVMGARTAQTEVLAEPSGGGTGSLAAEVSTLATERRGAPMWPLALVLVLFAGGAGTIAMMARRDDAPKTLAPTAASASAAVTSTSPPAVEPGPTPTVAPTVAPAASTAPKPLVEEKPSAKGATKPTVVSAASAAPAPTPVVAPAPSPSTAPTQSAYDKARASMNDGDLDAAEREARAAIATHGNGARLLLGEILEKKGKPALAREQYKKILETDPNNGVAKTRLAKLGG